MPASQIVGCRNLNAGVDSLSDLIPGCLHSGFGHPLTRSWQSERQILKSSFIYPVFVSDIDDEEVSIPLLPDIPRLGILKLAPHLQKLVEIGLRSVIIFGVLNDQTAKDSYGTAADDPNGPVIKAIRTIRQQFPELYVVADVCLCEYSDHGHCGILNEDGSINNQASVERISDIAIAYAREGLHCLAPSDMNDGRIRAIKLKLLEAGIAHQITLMAYSAKFSSCLYGPFRVAAGSTPSFGDRKAYQLPNEGRGLARRALARDIREGADIIMVKPAGSCLDIVRSAKEIGQDLPVAAYQVSGEYAMIHAGAEAGIFDLKASAFESIEAILRAGATIVISYFTPNFLRWLDE
ncbi:MAG: Aminolevulinate dehydratase [Sarea resinae]|nr:MAG: Aminolevulinate dehydratase [Sarea resinae]